MRILSWNVAGLRAAHRKGFAQWLREESPDIICLQEIKAKLEQLPEAMKSMFDYRLYINSADRPGYAGVCTYTKHKPESSKSMGVEKFDAEGRMQELDFGRFVLINCYFPNAQSELRRLDYKLEFDEILLKHMLDLVKQGRKVILCGDLNVAHKEIDLARPKPNEGHAGFSKEERAWADKLEASGFTDTFRMFNKEPGQYTYWDLFTKARDRNVGWRLDYFWVSQNMKSHIKDAFIMSDVMGSDHCPVGIEIDNKFLK